MQNFEFLSPTKIVFGKGSEDKIGEETKKYAKKVLLHYGGGSIKEYGIYDKVINSLEKADISFVELSGVQPNPRLSLVKEGIKICRDNDIDFILAVGGGSVIDSAKAIAAGTLYEGDVWNFYEEKEQVKDAIPIGVVLTIPAAGSEASPGSVITNEDGWYKRPINYDILRPVYAILNPEFTYSLPAYQTACGAVDIIAHVMERYFTNEKHVDFTDRLCEATINTMISNTPLAIEEPDSYHARAEMMWAGTIAHNDLVGTGRIGDWSSHNIEHELSGIYDVAHGAGLAVVFPAWMKYVYKNNLDRFLQFAVRVWDVEYNFDNPERTALEGIKRTEDFFKQIGLPTTLKGLGVPKGRFDEMAAKATEKGPLGNFVKLYKEDVFNILNLAK